MTCTECERPTIARGLCAKHYQRWTRRNPEQLTPVRRGPAIDRLLDQCIEDDGCWIYQGALDPKGYVRIRADGGKSFGHRIAWEHFIGPFPSGLTYDHLCKRKDCVNPWHGDPVPSRVNTLRSDGSLGAVNARKTHCPQGHELDGDNLRYATQGKGRVCRICRAESSRRYRQRKAAA